MLTARADGWLMGGYDQAEALRRCQAFATAGADVIYAPGVDVDTTRALIATGTPVNLLATGDMRDLSVAEMASLGVARISIGGGLARVAQRALRTLALETFQHIHRLSMRYHITRKTGGLSRIIERGVKGVEFLLRFLLFSIGPLILEL